MPKRRTGKFLTDFWGEFTFSEEEAHFWRLGSLKLWCRFTEKEIQIVYEHDKKNILSDKTVENPPDDNKWSRWSFNEKHSTIELSPIFPDRPVVVKPESPFRIARGNEARIYIRVPLWVRVSVKLKSKVPLVDIPTVILSNTWFGTFFEGEPCYWISTGARREIEPDATRPYLAISPNQLVNKSTEDLQVEKICLRVENLSLYSDGTQLWSDEMNVLYKGGSEVTQLRTGGGPPAEAAEAALLTPPRNPLKKGLTAKTFASIKDLPGLGIPTS